ncbi:MAG: succinylglutamate desuccinylase/aspartoacylase family protein [Verrucomicrobia bacterium]|nr:succinylglutamate desuccinylase/aspartoacylase family protein [Verrucomicrobiota bacterium]
MKRFAGWKSWLLVLAVALLPLTATAASPAPRVAAAPALDQAAGIIAAGTPAATPYYVRDSGKAGPTVVITGGVHGDEPAGAYAAEQIRHWPITRGTLIVVPRANVVALKANKRNTPGEPAESANLNRNFPKAKEGGPARGALATALWNFVRQQKPAWVVDLHEGSDFNAMTNKSVGSSVIVFPTPDGKAVSPAIQAAVNATVTNQNRRFTLRGPPVDGSLARAAGAHLGANALILETTTKSQALSVRARQHRIMVFALLARLDMTGGKLSPDTMLARAPSNTPPPIRLAVYDAGGTGGTGAARIIEQIGKQQGAVVVRVCGDDILAGALDQFNALAVPGGSGSKEAASIGEDGRARIRKFVENGGGYVGICAGAYLATSGFSWGLKILDAKTASPKWERGRAMVKIELTSRGREILGERRGEFDCKYANGPILCPANVESLPDYEPLAFFRTEVAEKNAPKGIMINSPAIVAGCCGKGRVIAISPHPEQTPGLEDFIPRAVAWVANRTNSLSFTPKP